MNADTIKLICQASCWLHLFPLKHNLQNNYRVQISESLPHQGQRLTVPPSEPKTCSSLSLISVMFTPLQAFSLLFYFMNRFEDLIFGYWIFFFYHPLFWKLWALANFLPPTSFAVSLLESFNIQCWMRDKPKYVTQTDGSLWTLTATVLSTKLSNTLYEDRIFVVLCIHTTTYLIYYKSHPEFASQINTGLTHKWHHLPYNTTGLMHIWVMTTDPNQKVQSYIWHLHLRL